MFRNMFSLSLGLALVLAPQVSSASNSDKAADKAVDKTAVPKDEPKKGNSGKHHEGAKPEGPIVDKWTIAEHYKSTDGKKEEVKFGTANLTINPDGSWNFSGEMNHELSGCEFNAVMAVKSSEGTVIAFKHSAAQLTDKPQSYSWEKQGNNRTLKDNYKAFAKEHDWYGLVQHCVWPWAACLQRRWQAAPGRL